MASKGNILLVEDDRNICHIVELYLNNQGYSTKTTNNGLEALRIFNDQAFDLLILDIMLPDLDGYEICKTVREKSIIPIIMLTARGEVEDRIQGLNIGADDYVTKPFHIHELLARVEAVLRRRNLKQTHFTAGEERLVFGNLAIHTDSHEVFIDEQKIELHRREFQVLKYLAEYPNKVFTREQLIENIWGLDFEGEDRVVDLYIKRLRKKLNSDNGNWSIRTVWGTGYKLEVRNDV
jgi:two-component system response regulator ResD